MGGLPEVEGLRKEHVIIGEDELHFVLVDVEDVAQARRFEFLQERGHVG